MCVRWEFYIIFIKGDLLYFFFGVLYQCTLKVKKLRVQQKLLSLSHTQITLLQKHLISNSAFIHATF